MRRITHRIGQSTHQKVSWQRLCADLVLVVAGLTAGLGVHLLRLSGLGKSFLQDYLWYPAAAVPPGTIGDIVFLAFVIVLPVLLPIACIVFATNGLYTAGKVYSSRYKTLVLVESVTVVYVIYAGVAYLTNPEFYLSRLIYLGGWASTCVLLVGSRVWTVVWRHMERSENGARAEVKVTRIVVVGGAGYIGSAVVRQLLERGYLVTVLDPLVYGDGPIADLYCHPRFALLKGDSRTVETVVSALRHADAVIHLGAIVGDSACALDEELTVEINVAATRMMAEVAKGYGVRRFVFASTCSVYGATDGQLTETSTLNPVSLYARSKIACEEVLARMADATFCPVVLRLATIYGLSPRPRFDLAVNLLTAKAVVEGEFTVFGGNQWRPFIHVFDVARALVMTLEADERVVQGQVFNVGSNEQNLQMKELGRLVQVLVPASRMVIDEGSPDARNYWVRFDKIRAALNFDVTRTLEDGIHEIVGAIRSGSIKDYRDPAYNNFQYLSNSKTREGMRLPDSIFALNRAGEPASAVRKSGQVA